MVRESHVFATQLSGLRSVAVLVTRLEDAWQRDQTLTKGNATYAGDTKKPRDAPWSQVAGRIRRVIYGGRRM